MNCKDVRSYWEDKYQKRFKKPYFSSRLLVELTLLKKLLKVYNEYIVLEAIDSFMEDKLPQEKVTIPYFATPSVFADRNKDLLRLKDIAKYYRYIKENTVETKKRKKMKELISEYVDYKSAMVLFDHEKERLPQIINELEGECDATRL
jgi:hypothetical protein